MRRPIQGQIYLQALLRLEGLVKGGAAAFDGFLDTLKTLQQVLTVQLNDRSALPTLFFVLHILPILTTPILATRLALADDSNPADSPSAPFLPLVLHQIT